MTNLSTQEKYEEVFGKKGSELEHEILKGIDTTRSIQLIETFLLRMLQNKSIADRLIAATIDLIVEANGKYSIIDLSEHVQTKRRILERKFAAKVGFTPKYLSRVIRMQSTLRQLLSNDNDSLTSLTYEEGYFDQAHLVREFKAFTGQTPKDYYGNNLKLSALFYGSK